MWKGINASGCRHMEDMNFISYRKIFFCKSPCTLQRRDRPPFFIHTHLDFVNSYGSVSVTCKKCNYRSIVHVGSQSRILSSSCLHRSTCRNMYYVWQLQITRHWRVFLFTFHVARTASWCRKRGMRIWALAWVKKWHAELHLQVLKASRFILLWVCCILLWVCCISRILDWILKLLCFCILIWNPKMEPLTVKIYLYSQAYSGFHLIVHCAWKYHACPQGLLCPPRDPWEPCKQKICHVDALHLWACWWVQGELYFWDRGQEGNRMDELRALFRWTLP